RRARGRHAPTRAPGGGRWPARRAQHGIEVDRRDDKRRREARRTRGRRGAPIKAGAKPDGPEVPALPARSTEIGERLTSIDADLATFEAQVEDLLLRIPNPAEADVPVGGEDANVTLRTWGEQLAREVPFAGEVGADAPAGVATWQRKPHWEIAEALDILDLPR